MKTTGNTILITGGGSGIGRGLAEAFHAEGNQVIISGRRQHALDEVTAANPGIRSLTVDMADPASVRDFAARLTGEFPALNVVVHNAGISRPENLLDQTAGVSDAEAMIQTNVLGPIRLTAALMPLLQKQPSATLITVSSGLAFLPLAPAPTYSATKAALHSYTESLRYQLKDTTVEVLEIIPPYVQTMLGGERQANDPRAMPLDDFIAQVMSILKTRPDETEVCVDNVLPLYQAAHGGREKYDQTFKGFNDAMASTAH